jgi:hypothetical protein
MLIGVHNGQDTFTLELTPAAAHTAARRGDKTLNHKEEKHAMNGISDETWIRIADLWFNQDYSPVEIAQEMSLTVEHVSNAVGLLDKLKTVIAQGMLDRVKGALRLE